MIGHDPDSLCFCALCMNPRQVPQPVLFCNEHGGALGKSYRCGACQAARALLGKPPFLRDTEMPGYASCPTAVGK